ncbi:MAG TPA: HAMP domain-containing protein [Solirubrobacteraceae bacterium]
MPAVKEPESAAPDDDVALRDLLEALRRAGSGDFSERLSTRAGGVMGQIAEAYNRMAENNESMSREISRVAATIGREGRLNERAGVGLLEGSYRESMESVNSLIDDLVRPTIEVGRVLTAVADGDLSQKMALEIEGQSVRGEFLRMGTTVNTMVDQLSSFADEVTRVAREVGTEGKLGGQAEVKGVSGTWRDLTENVNFMASNLTTQVRTIATVTTAVAEGDLSQKIAVEAKGEVAALADTINTMVDQLSSFADEVTRVAREVGTEGILGGQAKVEGVSGTWRDLTDSVNFMAGNLTSQVRNIAQVATAVADGDLSQKISVEAKGEVAQLAETINTMVDQLSSFADEVTRVAREVGTEGILGGQARVEGVAGTWRDLTDSVNFMAGNLTSQVRNIAQVTTAVAEGDLSQKISGEAKGEVAALADTINTMVDQLSSFADEVTRVAREVGTEGILGGQARVEGVSGTWRDLTDSVNFMAGNLTSQVRNIAQVTTAVAEGDLSQKISVEAKGEVAALADTINTMVDQLSSFADEVTRVAREVGTEGILGGQAEVAGVGGTWKDLTDNVNGMASNLTTQVRNIAQVTTAVARGDLTQKITVEAKGEVAALAETINGMTDTLALFADQVTGVAREVGTEGILGGQAEVPGVAGTWKDLTDNVNFMASNLTTQVRNIAQVATAVARGDLTQKITVEAKGEVAALADTINSMTDTLALFADQVTGVAREVGTQGRLGGQAEVPGVAGTWKDLTDSVNSMASNLTDQVRDIAQVTTAVAQGDLSQKITVNVEGEMLELKKTINTMVDQLSSFADEVTRVAREVGTEGQLGGQADVPGVAGVWRGLTENVNGMASNLTSQVRNIAQVATAVARGDLTQKITVDARGEILELKDVINVMVDQLSSFADEVTRVAKEVGTEGKLGGQAEVEGVSGTWKRLTENVNQLAGNLTTQVRAIAEVSTAVTSGDLTREITVEAAGELAELKDNINEMIRNLRDTTQQNAEQDWLKTNLARISGLMQGQRDLQAVSRLIMSELTPTVSAQHGAFFLAEGANGDGVATPVGGATDDYRLRLIASYGYRERKGLSNVFHPGESLVGQAALEKTPILITEAPGDYIRIGSGLGEAAPVNIMVLPIVFEDQVLAVIELASFRAFSEVNQTFLEQLVESLGVVLNTITATMRTEELLEQSQSLAHELQSQSEELQAQQEELKRSNQELESQARSLKASEELLQAQQEELRQTNDELEEKAAQLAERNQSIELKNTEIEKARITLEERAAQLALSSKYKSEFLANMSHELRTPLNSLLILAKLLSENPEGNLTPKQREFAQTIHGAGSDLLALINDILDLSKVEAGKMDVNPTEVPLARVVEELRRGFSVIAAEKGLRFEVAIDEAAPATVYTDDQRLQQVMKNLLSNAFKFTDDGAVTLSVAPVAEGLAFSVSDTGIGIAEDKLRVIFEAFQQADGTTSRKYGGTGLGLTISREIARLLGGELRVDSEAGAGSTFTIVIPLRYSGEGLDLPEDGDGNGRVGITGQISPAPLPAAYGNGHGAAHAVPAALEAGVTTVAPPQMSGAAAALADRLDPEIAEQHTVADDRDSLEQGDRVLLIIEDDPDFARIVLDTARERGFKGVVALRGDSGLALAHRLVPDAIVLDVELPGTDGLDVLDHLKGHPDTRHVPVHVISGHDHRRHAMRAGAVAYLEKPVTHEALGGALGEIAAFVDRDVRSILLVEDDETARHAIGELIGAGDDVDVTCVATSEEAIAELESGRFDCVVLDLNLPSEGEGEGSGFELLERLGSDGRWADLPVIVHTGRALSREEETRLRRHAESIIVKDVHSPERLLDETSLFLHRVEARLPADKRRMLEQLHDSDATLQGKRILIVDDDVRNVFALTNALEVRGMEVLFAENGADGIALLDENPDVDLVLMDVMMPGMDGYEAMGRIRQDERFTALPMIALTAKAMKGDREKSIAAGASDYITKPVETDQLLSLMRVWLYR